VHSIKQQNSEADRRGNTVCRVIQNIRSDFEEFVDENADTGGDDYYFASAGQGMRSGPNRATKNVNFRCLGNYKDVDEDLDLDSIKLKIPNSHGKNDKEMYLEWD
jgi:hypothetical protein